MNRTILQIAYKPIKVILIVVAVYFFLRGHNYPGGGFIGALIASAGYVFQAMIISVASAQKSMGLNPAQFILIGILICLVSAIPGWISMGIPMTGVWVSLPLPLIGDLKLGTPLLFDLGVFTCVFGVITLMSFQFLKHISWK